MDTFDEDDDQVPAISGPEVDISIMKQLLHSHESLKAEKKQMEEYFEEVDHESQKKNHTILALQDKLAQMKRDLDTVKLQAKNARADAAEVEAQRKVADTRRRRRTIPTVPSRNRIKSFAPGEASSVVAVDTEQLAREQLIAEIRSLESDLEYKHQETIRLEETLGRMQENSNSRINTAEELRDAVQDEEEQAGNELNVSTESALSADGQDLPSIQRPLTDVIAEYHQPVFVIAVKDKLEAVVVGIPEVVEQANLSNQLAEEVSVLQAHLTDAAGENHHLRDLLDELQHELDSARIDLREYQSATSPHETLADLNTSLEEETLGDAIRVEETLSDVLGEESPMDEGMKHALQSEQRLRAKAESEVESLKKKQVKLEGDIVELQDTIAASREVMGMTIEEQMVMMEEHIKVKIALDEKNDDVDILKESQKKTEWENKLLKDHIQARNKAMYELLERSIKARDRKALLNALKETEYTGTGVPQAADLVPRLGSQESQFSLSSSWSRSSGMFGFGRTPSASSANIQADSAQPKVMEKSTSTTSLKAAPAAHPFPEDMLNKIPGGDALISASPKRASIGTATSPRTPNGQVSGTPKSASRSQTPKSAGRTPKTPKSSSNANANARKEGQIRAKTVSSSPKPALSKAQEAKTAQDGIRKVRKKLTNSEIRQRWKSAIEQQIMLNQMEKLNQRLKTAI